MTSHQIHSLLAPPFQKASVEHAIAFINSNFKTIHDFDNVLEEKQRQRRDALQHELMDSQIHVADVLTETRSAAEAKLREARSLAFSRHELQDELSQLTTTLVSTMTDTGSSESTLLEDIEALHRNLKELQSIKGYVQVVHHGLLLSEQSVEQAQSISLVSPDSLSNFRDLQIFVTNVEDASRTSLEIIGGKESRLHLVEFLHQVLENTWRGITSYFNKALAAAAEKIGWPSPIDFPATIEQDRTSFQNAFQALMDLQEIGEHMGVKSSTPGLYAIQALIQPLSLRFKYHFEGNRQTNRPDKPEWYFTHILNIIQEHHDFMTSTVQSLIERNDIDAWCEFTWLLLPLLSRKLRRTAPSLSPALLAHTIYQALSFDSAVLEEGFTLQGTSSLKKTKEWEGLSHIILGQNEWFNAWLAGEKYFAEGQYENIISASDAWQIAVDDQTESSDMRTTNSARRVIALIEQVTDRYSPIPSFAHRMRFLLGIQFPILEQYHDRITSSLDAFETLSSALVRSVPGALGLTSTVREGHGVNVNVDTQRLTSGIEGVQRLYKALVSVQAIDQAMSRWGDDVFFLELWNPIATGTEHQLHSVLPERGGHTVFDVLTARYQKLSTRAEDMVVQQVCAEVESDLRVHLNSTHPQSSDVDLAVSQTLLPAIALLSTHLSYLRISLPSRAITSIYKRIAYRLSEHILHRQILYRGAVTLKEARVIQAECELWIETCHRTLGTGVGRIPRARIESPWERLLSASRVVSADGTTWTSIIKISSDNSLSVEEWEEQMNVILNESGGFSGLSREDVGKVVRRRS